MVSGGQWLWEGGVVLFHGLVGGQRKLLEEQGEGGSGNVLRGPAGAVAFAGEVVEDELGHGERGSRSQSVSWSKRREEEVWMVLK